MSLYRRADLSDLDRAAAKRKQRECQARRGFSQRQMLELSYNFGIGRNLIRGTRDGECNSGYIVYPKLLLAWLAEIAQKTRTEKILALRNQLRDHVQSAGLPLLASLAASASCRGINTIPLIAE